MVETSAAMELGLVLNQTAELHKIPVCIHFITDLKLQPGQRKCCFRAGNEQNQNHRITEWLRLEGTPGGHLVHPRAQAWTPRAACPGHVQTAFSLDCFL